ncbi:SMP-30/gluconolactonase/LRE family protein [Streptomyces sp. DSM 41524]|uniref:SMP-30/gluconolactonase/LRE family protein n=1 Tax=Streptomyces asiaticus subsp. ignotus TaxID=3098222 RepID=A0ABU7Q879_9ACTN|nr:SMP-30/gluconolactonase/LRE family protein [Streptomyces sp. DSM 41524]
MRPPVTTVHATPVASGFTFLEGPRWRDGELFASDFYSGRVLAFRPGRSPETGHEVRTVCEVPGRPSGLGFAPDGSLLVVSMLERALLRWDGRALTTVARFGHLIEGVANDMLVTESGWALIGNFGNTDAEPGSLRETALVRVSPDGRADLQGHGLVFPNGMVLTANRRRLLVAETFAGRVSSWQVAWSGDGAPTLGERRVWKQFGGPPGHLDIERATRELPVLPDGLAIDAHDRVWVASSIGHGARLLAPDGALLARVETGGLSPYAVAVGGADQSVLHLCCSPPLGTVDPAATTESVLYAADISALRRPAPRAPHAPRSAPRNSPGKETP